MRKRQLSLLGAIIFCAVVILVKELAKLPDTHDPKLTGKIG